MTININATAGDSAANSYATLDEANTYLEAHLEAATWSALNDERKKAALVSATRLIENYTFGGLKNTSTQSLAWPRTGVYDRDGYPLDGVPSKLKDAQCEIAIWILTDSKRWADRAEIETLESVSMGPVTYNIRQGAEYLPSFIMDMLSAIGPGVVQTDDYIPRLVL